MKRIVIAAPGSGTGKTSVSLGIMRALSRRGLRVQPFKTGPDYIDPAFHQSAAGRASRNLDLWLQSPDILKGLFHRQAENADIAVVEGVMGLYDGMGDDLENRSTAHVARVLEAPVILVIDGRGVSASAAALVKGFQAMDPRVRPAGVIVNQVSGEKHYEGIRSAMERYTGIPCIGWVQKDSSVQLESRHLGLVPSVETPELETKLNTLADRVEQGVDLDRLLELSAGGGQLESPVLPTPSAGPPVRIGYGLDEAFNFYYADNLDLLRSLGAELVPFSPVQDKDLPEGLQGLYFGGGFPEVFAEGLSGNSSMRRAVSEAALNGMPVFAECGGYMYLMDALKTFDGTVHPMCGILPGTAVMTGRLQRFGYVEAAVTADSILGPAGTVLRGHEFHRSVREPGDRPPGTPAYRLTKGSDPAQQWDCGENTGTVLAAYCHIHFYSNPGSAEAFVNACRNTGKARSAHG